MVPQNRKTKSRNKLSTISFSPTFRLGISGPHGNRQPSQWFFSERHSEDFFLRTSSKTIEMVAAIIARPAPQAEAWGE
jgi:hypothetical protein